jgi:Putative porin
VFARLFCLLMCLLFAQVYAQRPNLQRASLPDDDRTSTDSTRKRRNPNGSIFLNDSVRNVYGPNTVLQISEEDIFYNRLAYRPIDTTITNIHRWGYLQRFNYLYQDLGNIGTALNPLYPAVRTFSGAVSGFDAYRLFYETEYPKYFDTKSPYTKMNLIWGGSGRAMTRIEFSRNINPRWNFGFDYRPILVDKQLQRRTRGDRQVLAHYYDFYTSFKSKNEKYLLLANFRRTRHRVFENGGVSLNAGDTPDKYFDKEAAPTISSTETQQFYRNYHFFNQYTLANAFQLYNQTDFTRESNQFKSKVGVSAGFFDHWENVKTNLENAKDLMRLSTLTTETGFKGRVKFLFFNAYYKFRRYSVHYGHINQRFTTTTFDGSPVAPHAVMENLFDYPRSFDQKGIEHYLGGRLAFDIDSLTRLSGVAEINQRGNYSMDGKLSSRWVDATFTQSISRPSFLQTAYRGSHDFWQNNFKNITALKAEGFLKAPFKKFLVAPGLGYTLLSNYTYFRKDDFGQEQTVLPVQSSSVINIANPQLKVGITMFNKLKLSGHVINNIKLSDVDGALKIPDWLVTSQLALEDYWFTKHLQVQVGFDVTWRSSYQAMGYDVATVQYYIQNDERVGDMFVADVFLNGRLKRARFFFKYHNIVQLVKGTGYLITPRYPGQRNILDLGFELLMFD